MTFWSGETLRKNTSVVADFEEKQVDCNSYSIRMGKRYYITADKEGVNANKQNLKEGETLVIPPGQFAYLLSKETIAIPDSVMGFLSMRTGLKFQGLINVSGFHVDPGYDGKLVLAVYNAGTLPVLIGEGDNIFKLWLANLDVENTAFVFDGKPSNDISNDLVRGMSREILSLQSLSEKIRLIDNKIDSKLAEQKPTIDNLTLVYRTITLGVVGLLVAAILTVAFPTMYALGIKAAAKAGLDTSLLPTVTTGSAASKAAADNPAAQEKHGAPEGQK